MNKFVLRVTVAAAIASFWSASAGAATYNFVATPDIAPPGTTGFIVTFDDQDNDQLLNLSEITSFSGMDFGSGPSIHFSQISAVPDIPGAADGGAGTFWLFSNPQNAQITQADWTYAVSAVAPSQTPLPAALPLFATGLGAFGVLGWRRKRHAATG